MAGTGLSGGGISGSVTLNADLAPSDIPNLPASKINSGVFNENQIPQLPASKIGSGVLSTARLGTGTPSSSNVLYGDGAWRAVTEGDAFDLHDDITQSATIADTDRLLFSDEGSGGDPMRYTTAASLANYMPG